MSDFDFFLPIEKAENVDGKWILRGVISTSSRDVDGDIITANGLQSMADQINKSQSVPVVTSHNHEFTDEIGTLKKAWLDDEKSQCWVEAELDNDDPMAQRVAAKLAKGRKAGFSIGGNATKFNRNSVHWNVDGVSLRHVMITSRPKNSDTFALALRKALEELEKSDVSKEERDKHATYFENGEGKFPIFDEQSAESALHLIGHAPADKQPLIKAKACKILGDSHPACAVEKGQTMENDLEKAGAKFSADSVDALKQIHAAGNDEVKSKVKDLLGDQGADLEDPKKDESEDAIGLAKAQEDEKFNLFKSEVASLIKDEIAKAIKPVEPKGEVVIEKSESNPLKDYLSAAIGRSL